MENQANDAPVLNRSQELIAEELRLFVKKSLGEDELRRFAAVQVELDQCWDLLRQRRALRETGRDDREAQVRPANVVEKYVG